jgi:hypothetical protein
MDLSQTHLSQTSLTDFLGAILVENGYTPADAFRYKENHPDETKHREEIFQLRNSGDIRQTAALLRMAALPETADMVVTYFLNNIGIDGEKCIASVPNDIRRYGISLITGLIYNESFLSMTLNFHGILMTEARKNLNAVQRSGGRGIIDFVQYLQRDADQMPVPLSAGKDGFVPIYVKGAAGKNQILDGVFNTGERKFYITCGKTKGPTPPHTLWIFERGKKFPFFLPLETDERQDRLILHGGGDSLGFDAAVCKYILD